MFINGILFVGLVVLSLHLIVMPLVKKRPILINGFEGALLLAVVVAISGLGHPIFFSLAVGIGLFMYFTKTWIIYGVPSNNVENALEKAIQVTRITNKKLSHGYEIDEAVKITVTPILLRFCCIYPTNSGLQLSGGN